MRDWKIKFRNFNDLHISFSYYQNKNIRMDVYSGDLRLCELTADIDIELPVNMIALRDVDYSEEILHQFMWNDYIKCYTPSVKDGRKSYLCLLSENENLSNNYVMAKKLYAAGGAF